MLAQPDAHLVQIMLLFAQTYWRPSWWTLIVAVAISLSTKQSGAVKHDHARNEEIPDEIAFKMSNLSSNKPSS